MPYCTFTIGYYISKFIWNAILNLYNRTLYLKVLMKWQISCKLMKFDEIWYVFIKFHQNSTHYWLKKTSMILEKVLGNVLWTMSLVQNNPMKGVHQRSCSPGHTNTGYNCSTYHCSSLKPKPWLPRPKELPCPKGSSKDKKALAKRATLSKGSSGKNAKAQAKAKAKALTKGKTKVKKSFLKKNQLAKPGKMTLAQKIAKAAENAETGEEAANNLKAMLNSNEHSRVWSKHNVMMKNNKPQKERNAFDKLSKGEKGMQAALFMIKSGVPKFFHTTQGIKQGTTLDKR